MKTLHSTSSPGALRRRTFVGMGAAALGAAVLAPLKIPSWAQAETRKRRRIYTSIKIGMFNEDIPLKEKFSVLKEIGFDGVELNSPGGVDKDEALQASQETGLPIHGVVDSIHWRVRLSDPDPEVRARGRKGLITAVRDARRVGGSAVLLVPGKVTDPDTENHHQVWRRSLEEIRQVLPLASKLGVHILIENVWNNFLYDPEGPDDQSAALLAAYLDEFNSPWIGSYFDIGNHQRFGRPADWIRSLGRRIVKLDVKDWGRANGFCKIGDGDVDWPEVRKALREIGFSGWATAEVSGGNRERIREVYERMNEFLVGH